MAMGCVWSSLVRQLVRARAAVKTKEVVRKDLMIIMGFLDALDFLEILDKLNALDFSEVGRVGVKKEEDSQWKPLLI
jgi:hypothetical protein